MDIDRNEDRKANDPGDTTLDDLVEAIKGKNINAVSFLATDYLNHFGEVIMLLEMIAIMPECLEDARDWQPKSYDEHFRTSGLSDPEIYIRAYENAPPAYRDPFDQTIGDMVILAQEGIARIEAAVDLDDSERLAITVQDVVSGLRELNDTAASIVNADRTKTDQDTIDAIMGGFQP